MLLNVRPVSFWLNNKSTLVDSTGRMGWDVGPNQQVWFRVVRNPETKDENGMPHVNSETWQCDCPGGRAPKPISPKSCDHIQEAYLDWLNKENKKRQMKEAVARHATEISAMREESNRKFEEAQKQTALTRPVEPQKGFAIKPKRIINLKD